MCAVLCSAPTRRCLFSSLGSHSNSSQGQLDVDSRDLRGTRRGGVCLVCHGGIIHYPTVRGTGSTTWLSVMSTMISVASWGTVNE